MRRMVLVAALVAIVVLAASTAWASTLVAQAQEPRVDVDDVWPFWVALSGLVLVIGTLSLWDTRRRRRGPRG